MARIQHDALSEPLSQTLDSQSWLTLMPPVPIASMDNPKMIPQDDGGVPVTPGIAVSDSTALPKQ